MDETIEEMKERIYPTLKADAVLMAVCYRDQLHRIVDTAEDIEEESVTISTTMARDLVHICNFVTRLDSYGK